MVYSIIKIIAEETDNEAANKYLITVIRVFRNGIISLLNLSDIKMNMSIRGTDMTNIDGGICTCGYRRIL